MCVYIYTVFDMFSLISRNVIRVRYIIFDTYIRMYSGIHGLRLSTTFLLVELNSLNLTSYINVHTISPRHTYNLSRDGYWVKDHVDQTASSQTSVDPPWRRGNRSKLYMVTTSTSVTSVPDIVTIPWWQWIHCMMLWLPQCPRQW